MNDEKPSEIPQPAPGPVPMLSPDGKQYWDGSQWAPLPLQTCEWDGFEWKVKPTGIESEWDGKRWIAKPLGVESLWTGTAWAVKPQGESKFDGNHYVAKPDGVESAWDGERWIVKPEGRAYWTGSHWQQGRRPIIKFGVPIIIGVIVLAGAMFGALSWKSAHDEQARIIAQEEAKQQEKRAQEIAAGWTNAQSLSAVNNFLKAINKLSWDCYQRAGGLAVANGANGQDLDDSCIRKNWQSIIPPNARTKMQFQHIYGMEDSFFVTDVLGNSFDLRRRCKDSSHQEPGYQSWGNYVRGTCAAPGAE